MVVHAHRPRRRARHRGHRCDVRLSPASNRRLPRRLGRRQDALLARPCAPRRGDVAQPRNLRAAVDGRTPRPPLPPGVRRDAGVHRIDVRRAGRSGRRDGAVVHHVPRLGIPARAREPRRGRHGCLEPACAARLPGARARAADARGRGGPGTSERRSDRPRDLRRRGRRVRRRPEHSGARAPRRRLCRADHVLGQALRSGAGRSAGTARGS